ncbi:MAG: 3-deoxy-7-phosphoheptulonate synthase AroG [Gammaproteobacteria bacterium]|nr:3-deoxy-7-phosphoheptulonate synthase AroG [Gammaproteobacteria bacterium]
MKYQTDDLRIREMQELTPPQQLFAEYPITEVAAKTTFDTRQEIHHILGGEDDRLLVIIGPCSIHDPGSALEYAQRLSKLRQELSANLLVVMRVYFEKPRTTVGWKGLINDPDLDESFHINQGLRTARELLVNLNEKGIPAATEYLDPITPQYIADLISWGAIGARTTESQVHRELASGLSCPVGFKNATDGSLKVAIDAIRSAAHPHHFLSVTKAGHSAIFSTRGNQDTHIILRGGNEPNYSTVNVAKSVSALEASGVPPRLMIDFSHANSLKKHELQAQVGREVAIQISAGNTRIIGVMIESHLIPGRQNLVPGQKLIYGQSITDACMGWDESELLLHVLADAVSKRRAGKTPTDNP